MITLTLRHSPTPLKDQLRRLKSCFKELRRRRAWKNHVTGGVGFVEVKLSEHDGMWHVHLHVLCEGTFFSHRLISTEWHAVTGDSSIVHIARQGSPESMARYCSKYVTKPIDSKIYEQPEKLDEVMLAMKGEHVYITFGQWRKLEIEPEPEEGQWHARGNIFSLRSAAETGDVEAQRLWEAATRRWPRLLNPANGPPTHPDS